MSAPHDTWRRPPLTLFWWTPRRRLRTAVRFASEHGLAATRMARHGGATLCNFGDELSPKVLESATGRRVIWAPPHRAQVFGIGSILEIALPHHQAVIWGTGLRGDLPVDTSSDLSRVLAVRGPLTRSSMGLSELPVGDPGLLVRALYPSRPQRRGVVLLPHFSNFDRKANLALIQHAQSLGWRVVPPMRPVDQVVESIGRAELVLTSSLHGVIVSQALRVPSILISFEESLEPTFKYADHYASLNQSARHVPLPSLFGPQLDHEREQAHAATLDADRKIDDLVEDLTNAVAGMT